MSSNDSATQTNDKIVELLESLLEQHCSSETRHDSANREQIEMLDQLQVSVSALAERVAFLQQRLDERTVAQPEKMTATTIRTQAVNKNGAATSPARAATIEQPERSQSWNDWEQQKRRLLEEFSHDEPPLDGHAATRETVSEPPVELPVKSDRSAVEPVANEKSSSDELLELLDHMDPDDPALSDLEVRKQLVARLRQVEVDLSLERAQLAREKTQLDQLRLEMNQREKQLAAKQALTGGESDAGRRWRWMRFLGRKGSH